MQDRDVSLHKAKTLSKALHHQLMAPLPKQPVYACKSQSLFGQKHPKGLNHCTNTLHEIPSPLFQTILIQYILTYSILSFDKKPNFLYALIPFIGRIT